MHPVADIHRQATGSFFLASACYSPCHHTILIYNQIHVDGILIVIYDRNILGTVIVIT
jgi:hypothetical protein